MPRRSVSERGTRKLRRAAALHRRDHALVGVISCQRRPCVTRTLHRHIYWRTGTLAGSGPSSQYVGIAQTLRYAHLLSPKFLKDQRAGPPIDVAMESARN